MRSSSAQEQTNQRAQDTMRHGNAEFGKDSVEGTAETLNHHRSRPSVSIASPGKRLGFSEEKRSCGDMCAHLWAQRQDEAESRAWALLDAHSLRAGSSQ